MILISNTMNTVVMEQRREIAMLKAVGATKVRIFLAYMTSAMVMAVTGSVLGAFLGIFVTFGVLSYFGGLMGFTPAFSLHVPTVMISIVVGAVFVIIASIPALLKAMWVPVREGMEDKGITSNYGGSIDRILMSPPLLPRTVKMGIRNAAKRKGRSLSAVIQIAIAVGVFSGLVAFGYSLGVELSRTIDNMDYDIDVLAQPEGANDLNSSLIQELSAIQGVDVAEPYVETMFDLGDMTVYSRGYLWDTQVKRIDLTLEIGRWFDATEYGSKDRVAVLGKQLASFKGIGLGDEIEIKTATGTETLKVIGIDSDFYYTGMIIYLPMSTVQDMLRNNDTVTGVYLKTSTSDHGEIDRISVEAEDLLLSYGCPVKTDVFYKNKETTLNQNQGIVDAITYVSGMIVLISMVGLISNITLNILDRTKEIGVLRCVGAVGMKIRTIFTSEAIFLSILGWIVGIPMGYLIARFVSYMLIQMLDWEIPIIFPLKFVMISLVLVLVAAFVIAQFPILRAVRMRPGDALRYQ
jgi:putative ABC transport system permease protein